MENVPKIVQQRLKAASSLAGEHPDADVLTAFSERSLPERERASVLEHLARCGECREIVAFALPASEEVEPVLALPRRTWLSWPTMRWAFIAAGVVAIASFGLLQFHRENSTMALKEPVAPQITAKAENQNLAATPAAEPATKEQTRREDKTQVSDKAGKSYMISPKPAAEPQSRQRVTGGNPIVYKTLPHGPRMQNQFQYNAQQNANQLVNNAPNLDPNQLQMKAASPAPVAAGQQGARVASPNQVPAQTEMVMVEAAPAAPPRDAASVAQNQPAPHATSDQESKLERAKPAQTASASQTVEVNGAAPMIQLPEASVPLEGRSVASVAGSTRWTISSAGGLQRSFDQGATWQDVNVKSMAANAGATLDISADSSLASEVKVARAKQKDLAKKQASAPVFRAVAANGTDVWAGGVSGLLYHSNDAGDHWMRVMPNSAGASLTGDIVSLDFPDAQHGRIMTSNSESWITSNGGQTWQKQ